MQDRVGDVLGAGCGAGHVHPGDAGLPRVRVLVRLRDVLELVEREAALREERLRVAVGLDADGQDDQVVLGIDQPAAVLDVLVAQDEVAVVLLGDLGDPSLDVAGAHRLGPFVELVVAFAGGPDVHVVDGHVGDGQGAHDQLVLLDRVHAAEARAERVADGLVARTGAQDVGDPLRDLAVARPQDRVERPGRGQQAVHLHAGDDVLEASRSRTGA